MIVYQVQVPLAGLPVNLVLIGNREQGRVVFVRTAVFKDICDAYRKGFVGAVFGEEGFALYDEAEATQFYYNTQYDYKNIPVMLRWLQQQELEEPTNIVFG